MNAVSLWVILLHQWIEIQRAFVNGWMKIARNTTKVRNMILDATAGNRMIWPKKNPPYTIFMDKEHDLARTPDMVADFRFCPFRDDVFDCIIFDPPYSTSQVIWFMNKGIRQDAHGGIGSYYGKFKSKREMFSSIDKAQREFSRLTNRLCFKWNEYQVSLWKILPFFSEWKEIHRMEIPLQLRKGVRNSKNKSWWVTFIHSRD